MLDLSLAIAHHLLIFGIFGIICAEFWAVRPGVTSAAAALSVFLPIFAAAMARGYGEF